MLEATEVEFGLSVTVCSSDAEVDPSSSASCEVRTAVSLSRVPDLTHC